MKYQDIQYFELESSSSPSPLQDELLAGDEHLESASSSSSSMIFLEHPHSVQSLCYAIWKSPKTEGDAKNGYYSDRNRALTLMGKMILIVTAMVVLLKNSLSPTSPITPQELPAYNNTDDFFFGVDDKDDPRYCVLQNQHQKHDPGFMPYAMDMDRSHCEKYNSDLRWSQDLRCYNLKSTWCFATLDDGVFSIEELEYHHHGCQMKFYEKDGDLYHHDGRKMPRSSFQQRQHCTEPESKLWYSVQPKTGCGTSPLRFCREDGSVNWDLVHLHKHIGGTNALSSFQYNCREFQLIDLIDEGSEDTSQVEELCQEQIQGCANRLYRGCDGDGKISQELINNSNGQGEECLQFDELDSGLAGHETDQGVDLICLSSTPT
jgi:hypothetical protein